MNLKIKFLVALWFPSLLLVSSSNILFYFPAVNFSQKNAVWPLVEALAEKGHNVTFLSPITTVSPNPRNITMVAPTVLQNMINSMYGIDRFAQREAGQGHDFDYAGMVSALCNMVIGDNRHADPALKALFSTDTKFDLVVINTALSDCGFYVAKYFGAKTIHYGPSIFYPFHYDTYGISSEGAWIQDITYIGENVPMSFLERVYNSLMPLYWYWIRTYQISPALEQIARPLLGDVDKIPSLYDLEQNVSVVLLNTHVSADYARTVSPLFVDVGGMSVWKEEKELPKQFKDFMDTADSTIEEEDGGVVLITFGSTVLLNTVSERHQGMFFQLIGSFPRTRFIMRWEGPLPSFVEQNPPKNLLISKWLPQREILGNKMPFLGHPNLRAFITHGGISSVHEATYYGIPLIVLPLFADQDFNAYRVQTQEVGVRVEIQGITAQKLIHALKQVLTDKRFKDNVLRKSAIFRDRPQSPVETALFWTEFALRHNDTMSTLRPGNAHLNPAQLRLWDVYSFVVVVLLIAARLIMWLITTLFVLICGALNSVCGMTVGCGNGQTKVKKQKLN